MGILSGGVQQKYRNTQRLNKIKNQVDGALESLDDIKQMQIANLKNVIAPLVQIQPVPEPLAPENHSRRSQ